jgi:hypothetical protein
LRSPPRRRSRSACWPPGGPGGAAPRSARCYEECA